MPELHEVDGRSNERQRDRAPQQGDAAGQVEHEQHDRAVVDDRRRLAERVGRDRLHPAKMKESRAHDHADFPKAHHGYRFPRNRTDDEQRRDDRQHHQLVRERIEQAAGNRDLAAPARDVPVQHIREPGHQHRNERRHRIAVQIQKQKKRDQRKPGQRDHIRNIHPSRPSPSIKLLSTIITRALPKRKLPGMSRGAVAFRRRTASDRHLSANTRSYICFHVSTSNTSDTGLPPRRW